MGSSNLAILLFVLAIAQQHFLLVKANPAVVNSNSESVSIDNQMLRGSMGIRNNAMLAMAPSHPSFQNAPEIVYSGLQRNAFVPVTGTPPPSAQCSSTVKDIQLGFRMVVNDSSPDLIPFFTDILDKGEIDLTRECSKNNGESLKMVENERENILTNHQWITEKFKL
ncbi:uncharacterized protein LOC116923844 [Daphnia magna]|uniref:Uncharacterized protein n=1 Tax=Daphnia magna TaxID=35525 RepID=A0A0P5YMM5_9CRUS|nr:uncharacterized protein LOC116923844 [Daphnia magna]KZS08925.1 Uncharacterized protein APZ42_026955 [Daphnia magna]